MQTGNGWDRTLPCINLAVEELETHGWLVNQTRMWLSVIGPYGMVRIGEKEKTAFFSTSLMVQEQLTALDGNGQQESAPQSRMGSADGK